jgi:hypothetical protein
VQPLCLHWADAREPVRCFATGVLLIALASRSVALALSWPHAACRPQAAKEAARYMCLLDDCESNLILCVFIALRAVPLPFDSTGFCWTHWSLHLQPAARIALLSAAPASAAPVS